MQEDRIPNETRWGKFPYVYPVIERGRMEAQEFEVMDAVTRSSVSGTIVLYTERGEPKGEVLIAVHSDSSMGGEIWFNVDPVFAITHIDTDYGVDAGEDDTLPAVFALSYKDYSGTFVVFEHYGEGRDNDGFALLHLRFSGNGEALSDTAAFVVSFGGIAVSDRFMVPIPEIDKNRQKTRTTYCIKVMGWRKSTRMRWLSPWSWCWPCSSHI